MIKAGRVDRLETAARRPGDATALVCYLPLGDPAIRFDVASVYAEEGVDVFEIGVPSPNPHLDGATVRESMARALEAGTGTPAAAREIAAIRSRLPDQALLWMSYLDTVGEGWVEAVAWSGADTVLLPEPARGLAAVAADLEREGVGLARFVGAPPEPVDLEAAAAARGYVMVQARPGPTGAGGADPALARTLEEIRGSGGTAPLAVGFGIRDAAGAEEVASLGADAVVVGSAMVEAALEGPERLRALVRSLREALGG